LEDRQYIVRFGGRWRLTDNNPLDNGVMLAFLAWAQKRELYALLGLRGPPLQALGIKPKTEDSQGVKVELSGFD
jgi:hypothetical protein